MGPQIKPLPKYIVTLVIKQWQERQVGNHESIALSETN